MLDQFSSIFFSFQNSVLSGYTIQSGEVVGTGIAFEIINILQNKFRFNYTVIVPEDDVFMEMSEKKGAKNLLEDDVSIYHDFPLFFHFFSFSSCIIACLSISILSLYISLYPVSLSLSLLFIFLFSLSLPP